MPTMYEVNFYESVQRIANTLDELKTLKEREVMLEEKLTELMLINNVMTEEEEW